MKKKLDIKKLVLLNLPYVFAFYFVDKLAAVFRLAPGTEFIDKLTGGFANFGAAFANPLPSFHPVDLLIGVAGGALLKLAVYIKGKNRKKFRQGEEYGSARWGRPEDIRPYMDDDFSNNVILTQTEGLTMNSRPKQPKYARNKNILVIGGSGSGKTRFFVKPNLMQMHSSYVVTDPKGTVLVECGKMLEKNGYIIKSLNTINFRKSMHYNPFAYIRSEKDILKLVNTIIVNTKGDGDKSGEDFWVKAEKLYYTALIGYIWYEAPEHEKNFTTLLELINASEAREDDETFKNPVDLMFDELEERDPDHFAVKQYRKYKLAAGATWKTILSGKTLGYKVLNADGTHKWYARDDVNGSQLNNVIINILPITFEKLNLEVDGQNLTGNSLKVERGTTVQLCASCNKDAEVTFSIKQDGATTPITLSGNDVKYTTVGTSTTLVYVAEYIFNDVGSYTISFTAAKDGYTVQSTERKLTVTKLNLSNAEITFRSSNESTYEPYRSTTTAPGFTVTYNGKTLKLGVDYTASGTASSAGVSTQTLTIKAVEGSDYTGSKTAEWRIVPHKAKVEVGDVIKAYDGTTDLPDGKISLVSAAGSAGYQAGLPLPLSEGNGFELTDAKYDSANASETEKNISFTVKLTDTNYTFEDGTTEKAFTLNGAELEDKSFKINKAAAPTDIQIGTLNVVNGTKLEYTYDAKQLLPKAPKGTYGKVSYNCEFPFNLKNGYYVDDIAIKDSILTLTIDALNGGETGKIGTIPVYVTTDNYASFNLPLDLYAVNKITPVATVKSPQPASHTATR